MIYHRCTMSSDGTSAKTNARAKQRTRMSRGVAGLTFHHGSDNNSPEHLKAVMEAGLLLGEGGIMSDIVERVAKRVCILILWACTLGAQTQTGGISGTVTDPAGAIVPNAAVTVTNLETNEVRRQLSNETGAFSFAAMPPGR